MKRERLTRLLFGVLTAVLLLGAGSGTAMAKKRESTWFQTQRGRVFYYDENGKTLKDGKYKINGKYYYFDKEGVQRTGWQKIGDDYYYFRIGKKTKGYMLKSTTVNGITLKKGGKAKMTSYAKKKLPILYAANQKMRSLTKCADTKSERLKKCWDDMIANLKGDVSSSERWLRLSNLSPSGFWYSKDWDIVYAKRIFTDGYTSADCYTCGVVFAYLANACGYTAKAVSSGGHGWCEIGDYVYDPDWALVDGSSSYYHRSLSTTSSRGPAYKGNGRYKITI